MTATDGLRRTARRPGAVSAGAPQTSITARLSVGGQVVGDHRGDRAAEEDGVAVGGDLLAAAVPALEAVLDHQRGQGQRDQRGDPVADGEAERRLRADLLDGADQHAAGAGHGVLHLAAGGDDVEHLRRTASPSAVRRACLRSSWRNDAASRLSRLDADPHLVGPQLAAGVEPLRPPAAAPTAGRRAPGAGRSGRSTARVSNRSRAPTLSGSSAESDLTEESAAWHWTRRIFSAYSDMRRRRPTQPARRPARPGPPAPRPGAPHEHRDLDRSARPVSPTPTAASSWSSPTGPASPAGRTSPPRSGRRSSGSARTA